MNRVHAKGAAGNVPGNVQPEAGELTVNKTRQGKGAAKRVKNELWKKTGTLEHALAKIDRNTR